MYKIKQVPEDFIVKELIELKLEKEGKYFYYLLWKRNYTTLKALEKIKSQVKYAGNKDRQAVTEQYISAEKRVPEINSEDLKLQFVGRGNAPLSLGSHKGNYFEITLRNLEKGVKIDKVSRAKNYFGEQRFSRSNAEIGGLILKKKFKEAVELILKSNTKLEGMVHKNDYVGSLRKLPRTLLLLYIHAYQSSLFNRILEKIESKENLKIPLIGFETEIEDIKNKKLKGLVKEVMKEERITTRDFIIREIPELSSVGGERNLYMEIQGLEIEKPEQDELNKGKLKIKIKFSLDKGCYATVAVKAIMGFAS